jgi:hypothetical protein
MLYQSRRMIHRRDSTYNCKFGGVPHSLTQVGTISKKDDVFGLHYAFKNKINT